MKRVPQPEFSEWFKKELKNHYWDSLDFSTISGLSERTVKYLKDENRNRFQRSTLEIVLKTFEINKSVGVFLNELNQKSIPDSRVAKSPEMAALVNKRSKTPLIIGLAVVATMLFLTGYFFNDRGRRGATELPAMHSASRTLDNKHISVRYLTGEVKEIPVGEIITEPIIVKAGTERFLLVGVERSINKKYDPGVVIAFDSTRTERWQYQPFDTTFLKFAPAFDDIDLSDELQTNAVGTGYFFPESPGEYAWTFAQDPMYALGRFTILDPLTGDVLYSLWSWGRFNSVLVDDFDGDGIDEVVATLANNNLAKIISQEIGRPRDFDFGTIALFEPIYNEVLCVPAFYYKPTCRCKSFKWIAFSYPFHKYSNIGIEERGNQKIIRISSTLGIHYYLTYEGELVQTFAVTEWVREHGPNSIPPLPILQFKKNGIEPRLLFTPEANKNNFKLIYTQRDMDVIQALLSITIRLDNEGAPSYSFNGRPINTSSAIMH